MKLTKCVTIKNSFNEVMSIVLNSLLTLSAIFRTDDL